MQLVGATSKFIRKPFIWTYIKIGFLSSIVSVLLIVIMIFQLSLQIEEINFFTKINDLIILVCFIIFYGIFTSFISSYFITQRYLKLKFVR